MPVVTENTEASIPPAPLKKLPHAAPSLPNAPDFAESQATPVAPAKPPKQIVTAPPPPPLPKEEEQPPAPPVMPETPVKKLPPAPTLPKADQKMPNLPAPPPLPKADTSSEMAPTQVVVSKNKPQPPKMPELKTNDNIVALPPAPPSPPPAPAKKLVATSDSLPPPPSLPKASDPLSLPPPPSPPMPSANDLEQKIASEKAKINNEQIKSQNAVKSVANKMPTPKDLANAAPPSMNDLPPMPPAPPPMDSNSLPPLPSAKTDDAQMAQNTSKPSDLPPLDKLVNGNNQPPSPDLSASMAAKETVMVQPTKTLPATGNNGIMTMPYSEAETDVPLVEKTKLESVISQLEADKSLNVTIVAFASGTPEQASQAKRTSLARVLAVRKYFMDRNISADRINPRPLGNKAEGGVPDRVDIIIEKGARS